MCFIWCCPFHITMIFSNSHSQDILYVTWPWYSPFHISMIFPIVHGYDIFPFYSHDCSHRQGIPQFHILCDILHFTKPLYFIFYIANIIYTIIIFPNSHSCVFQIPMIISITHSYDACRYELSDMGIWPFISKPQQPATFQCQGIIHWGPDKMAAILQTTFSNEFSWMLMYEFRLWFHWRLFLRFEFKIFQHWFR